MPEMIILTESQTKAIAGNTTPGRALEPRDIGNGVWILPTAVLDDDHGADKLAVLRGFSKQIVTLPVDKADM